VILIHQRHRQTDGQTHGQHAISIPRYALVHRAVKMQGFMHFYCKKTTCDQKPAVGRGASLTFLGAEDIKRTGVENLAGGSIPPTPPSVNSQND